MPSRAPPTRCMGVASLLGHHPGPQHASNSAVTTVLIIVKCDVLLPAGDRLQLNAFRLAPAYRFFLAAARLTERSPS